MKRKERFQLDFAMCFFRFFYLHLFQTGHYIAGLKYLHRVKQNPKAWQNALFGDVSESRLLMDTFSLAYPSSSLSSSSSALACGSPDFSHVLQSCVCSWHLGTTWTLYFLLPYFSSLNEFGLELFLSLYHPPTGKFSCDSLKNIYYMNSSWRERNL